MGRPSKTVEMILSDGKSHRTKSELEFRKKHEKSLLTDEALIESPEVKKDKAAHKKFLEVRRLLSKIEQNDALVSSSVNTYCKLYSECLNLENNINKNDEAVVELAEKNKDGEIDFLSYVNSSNDLKKLSVKYDDMLMKRRDMMFKIERESLMTIASKLRAVPKAPKKDEEEEQDPMSKFVVKRGGLNA